MSRDMGCGTRLIIGVVIVAGIFVAFGVFAWYRSQYAGMRLLNPSGREVKVLIDGEPAELTPLEPGYAHVSFSSGDHHVQVEIDGEMAIDKKFEFSMFDDYFVFTGEGILIEQVIHYSLIDIGDDDEVALPATFSVTVDGQERDFIARDAADYELYMGLLEGQCRVFTKPTIIEIEMDQQTTMPYEEPPETISSKDSNNYRSHFVVAEGWLHDRLKEMLAPPQEQPAEQPPAEQSPVEQPPVESPSP